MKIKLKASYDNFDAESDATGLRCEDPSLAQQHEEPEANINNIVRRYLGGQTIEQHTLPPLEGDFTMVGTMQDAMNLAVQAREAFMEHPAEVRAQFNNSAEQFVQFCSNPDNIPEMQKMGLLSEAAQQRRVREAADLAARIKQDEEDAKKWRDAQKQKT